MKKMKRFYALVLAFVMVLGMSMTTMADELPTTKDTANITIKNAENATVKYLQVIVPDTSTITGWAFVETDGVEEAYVEALGAEAITDATDSTKVLATADQVAIAKLIKAVEGNDITDLPEVLANATVVAATAAQMDTALAKLDTSKFIALDNSNKVCATKGCELVDGKCSTCEADKCACEIVYVINVPENADDADTAAGVYAISASETGYTYKVMAAYVGFGEVMVDSDADEIPDAITHIYPSLIDAVVVAKKSPTSVEKATTDPDHAVAISDIVTYTIEAYVPFIDPVVYNDADSRTFAITDKIDGAEYYLTDTDSVATVMMEGEDDPVGTIVVDTTVSDSDYDASFTIDLSTLVKDLDNPYAGKKITVTYTAKVTEVDVVNKAASHVPDADYEGNEVKLYTGNITLTKTNEDGSVTLENAGFKVTMEESSEALKFTVEGNVYTYAPEATGNDVKTEVFTGADGTVVVEGLDIGTYKFTETTAPKGYSINETPTVVTLDIKDENEAEDGVAVKIFEDEGSMADTKLLALPSTGGIGTTIFTVAGCAIMIAAAVLLLANRRREAK